MIDRLMSIHRSLFKLSLGKDVAILYDYVIIQWD